MIKWFNENLIEVMCEDFTKDQKIPLVANLDIGTTWEDLEELPNDCSLEEIQQTLSKLMV